MMRAMPRPGAGPGETESPTRNIDFRFCVTPEAHRAGRPQILQFGRAVKLPPDVLQRGGAQLGLCMDVDRMVDEQLPRAFRELELLYSLNPEKGPYADRSGIVESIASHVGNGPGGNGLLALIQRTSEIFRPLGEYELREGMHRKFGFGDYAFVVREDFRLAHHVPATAGDILTQEERVVLNVSPAIPRAIALVNPFESYMLATAVLKKLGVSAYPAMAVRIKNDVALSAHLVSCINLESGKPLTTFPLLGAHPPMNYLMLLGDFALMSFIHAFAAQSAIIQLAQDVRKASKKGIAPDPGTRLEEVAGLLFRSYQYWPTTLSIEENIRFLAAKVVDAFISGKLDGTAGIRTAAGDSHTIASMAEHIAAEMTTLTTEAFVSRVKAEKEKKNRGSTEGADLEDGAGHD